MGCYNGKDDRALGSVRRFGGELGNSFVVWVGERYYSLWGGGKMLD